MKLAERIITRVTRRPADFVIGGAERPYLRRWWVIPRNRWFNVYLHQFLRSDDDRALHDHPWLFNASWLLRGGYTEHIIAAGGIEVQTYRWAGDWKLRIGPAPHRVELFDGEYESARPCWTLFITGPRYRSWGFHCPEQGWIRWDRFTAGDDSGAVGKGCDA